MLVGEAVSKKQKQNKKQNKTKKKTRKSKFTRKLRSYIVQGNNNVVQGNNNELHHRRVRALPLRLCNWHTHNTDTHTHTHKQNQTPVSSSLRNTGYMICKHGLREI